MAEEKGKLGCSAEVLALVPESLARECSLFPLKAEWGGLTVAVTASFSTEDLDKVEFVIGRKVHGIIYPAEAIRRALDDHYGEEWFEDDSWEAVFYWRDWRGTLDDGTIKIKTSWYDKNLHMTGCTEIAPDHPDFGLWTWIIAEVNRFAEIISGDALEVIRNEYEHSRSLGGPTGPPAETQ